MCYRQTPTNTDANLFFATADNIAKSDLVADSTSFITVAQLMTSPTTYLDFNNGNNANYLFTTQDPNNDGVW